MTTCAATTPLICTGQMLPSPQRDLSTCTPQQPASNNTTCINNSNTASHNYSLTPYTKHEDNNSNMAYIAEAGDTNMQSIYCRGYSDCSGHVSPLTVYSGRDSTNRGLLTPFPVHMSEHGKGSRSSAFHNNNNNNNIHIPRRVKEIPFSCIRPNKLIDTLHYHLDVLHEAIITRVYGYTSYPHIPRTRGHTTPERQTEDTENHFSTSDNNTNNIIINNNNNNNNNNNTVDRDLTTPRNASILDNRCKRKYNYYHDLLCKMSDILVAEAERVYPKRGLSMGIISNSALNNNNNNNNKDINRIISNRSSISISDIYHCYNNGLSHEHHVSPNTEDNNNINNNNNNDNNNNNSFLSTAGTMIAKLADELIKCRTENNNNININNNNIKRGNENHCNDTKSLILLGSPSPLLTNKIINMNNNIINTDYSNKGYTYLSSWNKFISLMTCYIPTDHDLRSINNSRRNINNNLNNNNLNNNKLPNMYLESENAIDITKKESHIQITDTKIRNMSLTTIYRLCEYFVTNTLVTDKDNNIKDNINNNNNNNNNSDIANVERLNTVYTDQSHGDTYNNNNNLNNNLNNINDVFTIKDAAAVVTYWKRLRGIV